MGVPADLIRKRTIPTQCTSRALPGSLGLNVGSSNDSSSHGQPTLKVSTPGMKGGAKKEVRPWTSYIWFAPVTDVCRENSHYLETGILGINHLKNASLYNDSMLVFSHTQHSPTSPNTLTNRISL